MSSDPIQGAGYPVNLNVTVTVPASGTVSEAELQEAVQEAIEEHCGCNHSPENSAAAYQANQASDAMAQAFFMNQIMNQIMPLPANANTTPPGQVTPMPYPMPDQFDPSAIPADLQLDPAKIAECLGLPPGMVPDAGTIPTPEAAYDGRVTRADIDTAHDDLTRSMNAIQGDRENDFDFGINWGPFSDQKETFDNKMADLRGNPTLENYEKVAEMVRDNDGMLGPDAKKEFEELRETVEFIEMHQGVVVDEEINTADGIQRGDRLHARGAVSESLEYLRENNSFSDASVMWGLDSSDKHDWNKRLDGVRDAIQDGDFEAAMEDYNWLRERAEGSSNLPRASRDVLLEMEQYLSIAANPDRDN